MPRVGTSVRHLWILTLLALGTATPVARAAVVAPVRVPGWNVTGEQGVAVDAQGRGLLAFNHGEHVRVASVAPDGRIARVAKVVAPRAVDGASDLAVGMDANGGAVAAFTAFNGEMPRFHGGLGGFGFLIRPYAVRFRWGGATGPARAIERGTLRADDLRFALRADGTAALLYSVSDFATDEPGGFRPTTARLAPGRAPRLQRLGMGETATLGLGVDAGGRFVASFQEDRRLALATTGPDGRFGAVARFTTGRRLGLVAPLVAPDGTEVAVWQAGRDAVRVARRPPGATGFAAPRTALSGRRGQLLDAAVGPDGRVAVLFGVQNGGLRLVVRDARGRSVFAATPPGRWSTSEGGNGRLSPHVLVGADGAVSAVYARNVFTGRRYVRSDTEIARFGPDGRALARDTVPDCLPGRAARGPVRTLVALSCGNRQSGFVVMVAS